MSGVFHRGVVDTIRVEIPAVVFGRWAAHPSVSYDAADAAAVDDGAFDPIDPTRTGWVVTHVLTGRTLPADIVDGLTQGEAEAIACALEDSGEEALAYSFSAWGIPVIAMGDEDDQLFADWEVSMRVIVDIVYRTLDEVAAASGGEP